MGRRITKFRSVVVHRLATGEKAKFGKYAYRVFVNFDFSRKPIGKARLRQCGREVLADADFSDLPPDLSDAYLVTGGGVIDPDIKPCIRIFELMFVSLVQRPDDPTLKPLAAYQPAPMLATSTISTGLRARSWVLSPRYWIFPSVT